MSAIKTRKVVAKDLEPDRPTSFLQSATLNPERLLKADSAAVRMNDAQNTSVSYVVRKVHSRRGSLLRRRSVLTILCDKGMPAALMVTPLKEFQAWMKIRSFSPNKLKELQTRFLECGGKDVREWPFKYAPRGARQKIVSESKFASLMYLDDCIMSTHSDNEFTLTFCTASDGAIRKPKSFEFRPEPFVKLNAEAQCAEARRIILCGALNCFLQRPIMVDRPSKPMDIGLWCESVKQHVSATTAYGKTNLHHHIHLNATGQHAKVESLLDWGADPNAVYGPAQMTALHMAASWQQPHLVAALLRYDADPCKADLNGLTSLHCAVVYGDLESVRTIVATKKVDLNQNIKTVRGEMGLLDCALECEADDDTVLSIWEHLEDCGAESLIKSEYEIYPSPFPKLSISRFLNLVFMATKTRWQTSVSDDGSLVTHWSAGTEGVDDVRKMSIMLNTGMDPNETDVFGRSALCMCTSYQATELLLQHQAKPAYVAHQDHILQYAKEYVRIHFLGTVADVCDKLRKAKINEYQGRDPPLAILAERMGIIVANTQLELQAVFCRAVCAQTPMLDALSEGKVAKAELLVKEGVSPCVSMQSFPPQIIDFTDVLPQNSEQYRRFEKTFGKFYWDLAMKLIKFKSLVVQSPGMYGSSLLTGSHAKKCAFRGLNLPQHKDMEQRYSALVTKLSDAEPNHRWKGRPIIEDEPSASCVAEAQKSAHVALSDLYQNPLVRLLEEANNAVTSSFDSPPCDSVRRRSTNNEAPRVGSSYTEMLEMMSVESNDEKQVAAEVSKAEALLRTSRSSVRSSIFENENWDSYRQRTLQMTNALVEMDEEDDV